jgi:hypothetical protein
VRPDKCGGLRGVLWIGARFEFERWGNVIREGQRKRTGERGSFGERGGKRRLGVSLVTGEKREKQVGRWVWRGKKDRRKWGCCLKRQMARQAQRKGISERISEEMGLAGYEYRELDRIRAKIWLWTYLDSLWSCLYDHICIQSIIMFKSFT